MTPSIPVEFGAVDGHRLRGRAYGHGERWVVLVHDEGQDSRAWRGIIAEISARGFHVLSFDLSGYGASDGPRNARLTRGDISAALDFARAHGGRRLYLVAAGSSASAALVAADGYPAIRALVALSPRPSPVLRSAPRETRAPKLIIVGSLNGRAERQADEVFDRSVGWVVLNSQPVSAEGTDLLTSTWGDHVREQILGFLQDYFFDTAR